MPGRRLVRRVTVCPIETQYGCALASVLLLHRPPLSGGLAQMPSVLENKEKWSTYHWDHRGESWSSRWGGSEPLWFGTLLPRLHAHFPAGRILEIAPGFGRMTQYLIRYTGDYIGIDVTPRCVAHCRVRFDRDAHARFFVNDGLDLGTIEDDSVDFVFSWDSLVHAEHDVLEGYLAELGRKLKPGGAGFIHHSNLGAYRLPGGELPIPNPHWRASTMTAELFRQYCAAAGLRCVTQEVLSWAQEPVLNDCFSYFVRDASPCDTPTHVVERPDFFLTEVPRLFELQTIYARHTEIVPAAMPIDWSCEAELLQDVILMCQRNTVATASLAGQTVHLVRAELGTDPALLARTEPPGAILKVTPHAIVVQTGKGTLILRELRHLDEVHPASSLVQALGAARFG